MGGTPGAESSPEQPSPRPSNARWIREAVIVVVVAVLVAVLLRAFVVQTFYIPSGSMEPTLQIGDRILVNKLSYHLHGVDRVDIVVFARPPAEDCGGPEALEDMLASISEPETDLGREWLEWLGPGYDPEACDLLKINRALGKLGK